MQWQGTYTLVTAMLAEHTFPPDTDTLSVSTGSAARSGRSSASNAQAGAS